MSFVLILSGTLLLINYMKKTTPDMGDFILWVAIANIVVGFVAYLLGLKQRRDALKPSPSDKSEQEVF